jgi:nucleotide-binding universal stress UspA family protein
MSTFRHLLVATDFGKPAERAVDWAVTFAERFDAKVTLLFVFALSSPYTAPSQHLDALRQEGQRMLDAEAAKLSKRLPLTASVVRSGSPWEEILGEARDCGADLIVMGTRGRRGRSRGPIGSVAERRLTAGTRLARQGARAGSEVSHVDQAASGGQPLGRRNGWRQERVSG